MNGLDLDHAIEWERRHQHGLRWPIQCPPCVQNRAEVLGISPTVVRWCWESRIRKERKEACPIRKIRRRLADRLRGWAWRTWGGAGSKLWIKGDRPAGPRPWPCANCQARISEQPCPACGHTEGALE